MVAAILLSVSILATVVSGVVVSMAFSYGTTRRVQGEAIYDEFMSRMVDDSASRARDYYQAYLQGEAEGQENHTVWYYKDYLQRKTVTSSSRSCRRIQRNIQHLKIMSRRIISSMKCCHSRHNCLKDQPASVINYRCRILLSSGKKIMCRMSTAMTTGLHMRKMRMFFFGITGPKYDTGYVLGLEHYFV